MGFGCHLIFSFLLFVILLAHFFMNIVTVSAISVNIWYIFFLCTKFHTYSLLNLLLWETMTVCIYYKTIPQTHVKSLYSQVGWCIHVSFMPVFLSELWRSLSATTFVSISPNWSPILTENALSSPRVFLWCSDGPLHVLVEHLELDFDQ